MLRSEGEWSQDPVEPVLLAVPDLLPLEIWLTLTRGPDHLRIRTLMVGVASGRDRVRLLRSDFGDAVGLKIDIPELDARAQRLIRLPQRKVLRRDLGPLQLDLAARQAFRSGRSLGLFPREFALIWRLAQSPGAAISHDRLLRDVWNLAFRPETNTLAVHVSRLRAKLRAAGLGGLLETLPDGGYRLALPNGRGLFFAARGGELPLDAHLRLREHGLNQDREPADAGGIEA
jgi:DNA-binding response OmpR family regulator